VGSIGLPLGYRLRLDPDLPVLCRPDGSEVAAFSARGTLAERVEAVAWEDARAKFTRDAHSPGPIGVRSVREC
jgi:hypothetical protein